MIETEFFGTFKNEYELKSYLSLPCHCIDGAPNVYVGTYGKYNDGNLDGRWVTITNFETYEEFVEFCRLLHNDEYDPEIMYQDYENFPRDWYCESGLGEETFYKILQYGEMIEEDRDAFDAYMDITGDDDFSNFRDAYMGKWDSMEDFARYAIDEFGYEIPEFVRNYFDYEAFARDLSYDYSEQDGFIFRHC